VLLAFIAFDIWGVMSGSRDGTAHWAHVGGFAGGILIAVAMLLTRQIDARGGDAISLLFGSRAWKLLGTPAGRDAAKPMAESAI